MVEAHEARIETNEKRLRFHLDGAGARLTEELAAPERAVPRRNLEGARKMMTE